MRPTQEGKASVISRMQHFSCKIKQNAAHRGPFSRSMMVEEAREEREEEEEAQSIKQLLFSRNSTRTVAIRCEMMRDNKVIDDSILLLIIDPLRRCVGSLPYPTLTEGLCLFHVWPNMQSPTHGVPR